MNYQYKIVVNSRTLYREFTLAKDMEKINLGTLSDCEFRLDKTLFFEDFKATFTRNGEIWSLVCDSGCYINKDDLRKFRTVDLEHGDKLSLRYIENDNDIITIRFMIDFETRVPSYNRKITLPQNDKFTIGSDEGSNLVVYSEYSDNCSLEINVSNSRTVLKEVSSEVGVYLNGRRIEGEEELQDYDFFTLEEFSFFYLKGELYFENRNVKTIENSVCALDKQTSRFKYPMFNRNTRLHTVLSDEKIKIKDAPDIPQKPKQNVVQALIPSLMMVVMIVVSRSFMDTSSAGYLIFSIGSMSIGVITTLVGLYYNKKDYKKDCKDRYEKYSDYLERKRTEIEKARQKESDGLNDTYYDTETDINTVLNFDRKLFDRSMDDEDFTSVYLGKGRVKSRRPIENHDDEKLDVGDELTDMPQKLHDIFEYIDNVPVVVPLKDNNVVGVIGDDNSLYAMFKNMVIDLATRQYYQELRIVAMVDDYDKYSWMKFLPHLVGENGIINIISDNESKGNIFESLYRELNARSELSRNNPEYPYHIVVLVQNEYGIKTHPLSQYMKNAKELGITFVFFEDLIENLPVECDKVIELMDSGVGQLINSKDKTEVEKFCYATVSDSVIESVCRKLSPVFCEEISLEGSLTKNISLYELLHIYSASDLNLKDRWNSSEVFRTMAAPLGVNAKNEVVCLDLHEKAHGPHGLVAGTTGSGKSEILQSFIVSLATLYHPYEVGFVIIDFKGGGMANQFEKLPHLIGTITNIDGNGITRSLKSIKAELMKRQECFSQAGVNHIDKYIKKYKAGEVKLALPHLIIIVDEFAELKAEHPDFMKELISTARIGRSLGVHLILATQKPSGVVDGQIWSNSKFKLCLKVQSPEDSNEVLKTPLAAEIKEPGRAYLQVGNNEIFELFQSAYSGGPATVDGGSSKPFKLFELNHYGQKKLVYERKKKVNKDMDTTQLDSLVMYINKYCTENGIKHLPEICMPPLPSLLTYEDNMFKKHKLSEGIYAGIGLLDDPDHQEQFLHSINLTEKNVIIVGSSQTGKTNLLQAMIRNLAETYSPKQVNMYAIDCGSLILKNFEKLNHFGGVVSASEDEKVKNLLKLLHGIKDDRKRKLAAVGVSSFASYLEAGYEDMPQVIVFIDNLTIFRELYLENNDYLLPLLRDGIPVGISFVVANAQTNGISYRYLNNFDGRIALFCNDSSEYSTVIDGCRMRIENIPGRALVKVDKEAYETQVSLAFPGEKEIDRVSEIRKFVEEINKKNPGAKAKLIPEIPENLTREYMEEQYSGMVSENEVCFGLDYDDVEPVSINPVSKLLLAISGKEELGRRRFEKHLIDSLINNDSCGSDFYICDGITKAWAMYQDHPNMVNYSAVASDSIRMVNEIAETLSARYEAVNEEGYEFLNEQSLIVLVVENKDSYEMISNDNTACENFKSIIGKYKDMKVLVLFTDFANEAISYSACDVLKAIKNMESYVIFDEVKNIKFVDFTMNEAKRFAKKLDMADAYYLADNNKIKLRTLGID